MVRAHCRALVADHVQILRTDNHPDRPARHAACVARGSLSAESRLGVACALAPSAKRHASLQARVTPAPSESSMIDIEVMATARFREYQQLEMHLANLSEIGVGEAVTPPFERARMMPTPRANVMVSPPMSASNNPHRYRVLWLGLLITVLGVLSNGLYFLALPGQEVFPWINVSMPAAGLVVLLVGVRRAFVNPQTYGGKLLAPALAILSSVVFAVSAWGLHHARDLPAASGAPRVGEKAPDFILASANGQATSLSQLLLEPMSSSAPPKAVLLVFYRGYW